MDHNLKKKKRKKKKKKNSHVTCESCVKENNFKQID